MPITDGSDSQLGSSTLDGGASALGGAALFTDVGDIYENTRDLPNGIGGFTDHWQTTATAVPCSITAHVPHSEATDGEKVTSVGMYLIQMPTDTVIYPSNRFLCNGSTYEVQDRNPTITNQTSLSVWTRLVE